MEPKRHRYTTEQLRAIKSPARSDVLTTLLAHGSGTIKQLAQWTGRELTSLYPHVRALVRVGLLRVQVREGKRRPEQVFEPVAPWFDRSLPDPDPEFRQAYVDSVVSSMKNVGEKVKAAAESNQSQGLFVATMNVFLEDGDLAQFIQSLEAVIAESTKKSSPETGRRVSLVIAMAPAEPDL